MHLIVLLGLWNVDKDFTILIFAVNKKTDEETKVTATGRKFVCSLVGWLLPDRGSKMAIGAQWRIFYSLLTHLVVVPFDGCNGPNNGCGS